MLLVYNWCCSCTCSYSNWCWWYNWCCAGGITGAAAITIAAGLTGAAGITCVTVVFNIIIFNVDVAHTGAARGIVVMMWHILVNWRYIGVDVAQTGALDV